MGNATRIIRTRGSVAGGRRYKDIPPANAATAAVSETPKAHGDAPGALRARLVAATVEALARGGSPRLAKTRA